MAIKQWIAFMLSWVLLLNRAALSKADQFDTMDPKANSICFTSEDCHRESDSKEGQQQPKLPLFCRNRFECLCNRQQLHTHIQQDDLMSKCAKCTLEWTDESVDPCGAQDPYSFCNRTSAQCECSLNSNDVNAKESGKRLESENILSQTSLFSQSICLHKHIVEHLDSMLKNNTTVPDSTKKKSHHVVLPHTPTEWLLTILLAYVLPCSVIFALVYFLYKQRCFCGPKDSRDSEMILYRQL